MNVFRSFLAKLEAAGYVTVAKDFVNNRPRSEYRLTPAGSAALNEYVTTIRALLDVAR